MRKTIEDYGFSGDRVIRTYHCTVNIQSSFRSPTELYCGKVVILDEFRAVLREYETEAVYKTKVEALNAAVDSACESSKIYSTMQAMTAS